MTERTMVDVTLNVNGRSYEVRVEPRRTLADTLRDNCGLTGTHLGCEHGVCGACTILADGHPVRSLPDVRGPVRRHGTAHRRGLGRR